MRSDSNRLPSEFKACKKGQTMSTKNIMSEHFLPARGDASAGDSLWNTDSVAGEKRTEKTEEKYVL